MLMSVSGFNRPVEMATTFQLLARLAKHVKPLIEDVSYVTARPIIKRRAGSVNYDWFGALPEGQKYWKFNKPDSNWGTTLHEPFRSALFFYKSLLGEEASKLLSTIIEPILASEYLDDDVIEYLKDWNAHIKTTKGFKRYAFAVVDLQTLYGYAPKMDAKAKYERLLEEVEAWVTTKGKPIVSEDAQAIYDELLYRIMRDEYLLRTRDKDRPTFTKEYVMANRWIWGAEGSGTNFKGSKEKLHDVPHDMRNKWLDVLFLSDKEVETLLMKKIAPSAKAFLKPDEVVKQRGLVNADLPLHIKMSVLEAYTSSVLDLGDYTDVYGPSSTWYTELAHMNVMGNDPDKRLATSDESDFDKTKQKTTIDTYMRCMIDVVEVTSRNAEEKVFMLGIIENIRHDIFPEYVIVAMNKLVTHVKYEMGVLSGWRNTAVIDTHLNRGKKMIVKALCPLLASGNLIKNVSKGDDAADVVTDKSVVDLDFALTKLMGYKMNAQKVSFGTIFEFLRMMASPEDVNRLNGYPVRAVKGIIYRRPGGMEGQDRLSKAHEVTDNWCLLLRRLRGLDSLGDIKYNLMMIADIAGATHWHSEDVKHLLNTPQALGGLRIDGEVFGKTNTMMAPILINREISSRKGIKETIERIKSINPWVTNELVDLLFPPRIISTKYKLQVLQDAKLYYKVRPVSLMTNQTSLALRPTETYSYGKDINFRVQMYKELRTSKDILRDTKSFFDMTVHPLMEYVYKAVSRQVYIHWVLQTLPSVHNKSNRFDYSKYPFVGYLDGYLMRMALQFSDYRNPVHPKSSHTSLHNVKHMAAAISASVAPAVLRQTYTFCT